MLCISRNGGSWFGLDTRGVLNFELGTDVQPEVSTTTL